MSTIAKWLNEFLATLSPAGMLITGTIIGLSVLFAFLAKIESGKGSLKGIWKLLLWFFILGGLTFSHPTLSGVFRSWFWEPLGAKPMGTSATAAATPGAPPAAPAAPAAAALAPVDVRALAPSADRRRMDFLVPLPANHSWRIRVDGAEHGIDPTTLQYVHPGSMGRIEVRIDGPLGPTTAWTPVP